MCDLCDLCDLCDARVVGRTVVTADREFVTIEGAAVGGGSWKLLRRTHAAVAAVAGVGVDVVVGGVGGVVVDGGGGGGVGPCDGATAENFGQCPAKRGAETKIPQARSPLAAAAAAGGGVFVGDVVVAAAAAAVAGIVQEAERKEDAGIVVVVVVVVVVVEKGCRAAV